MSLSSVAAQEKSTKDTNEYTPASCTGNRHCLLDIKPAFGSSSTQLELNVVTTPLSLGFELPRHSLSTLKVVRSINSRFFPP